MSKQANPVMIGGFVLGAVALLVTAILVFSSGALFQQKRQCVSYFPGTIQGLSIGSRVEFQGVQVGQVTDVALEYDTDNNHFQVPVHYELWKNKTQFVGSSGDRELEFQKLIEEEGLRAKLKSVSLVTGQYMIALTLQPDTPLHQVGVEKGMCEIPTIEADRDRLGKTLARLDLGGLVVAATEALDAIKELAANKEFPAVLARADETLAGVQRLIEHVDPLLTDVDTTVEDYATLADSLVVTSEKVQQLVDTLKRDAQRLTRSASGAFDQADKTLNSIDGLVSKDSVVRYDLELTLEEAAGAARSLRILADYLQQHPDALIKGK